MSWVVNNSNIWCLFSCNLIGYFKQTMKSDWLLRFRKAISLTGKKIQFEANNGAIRK